MDFETTQKFFQTLQDRNYRGTVSDAEVNAMENVCKYLEKEGLTLDQVNKCPSCGKRQKSWQAVEFLLQIGVCYLCDHIQEDYS